MFVHFDLVFYADCFMPALCSFKHRLSVTPFTPKNAIYPETALPQCYLRWRHGVHNSVIVATLLMGGLAQLYDPPTPTVQWLVGKNATVYQVCKYVGKLMVVSIISVMRNLHISISCILHFRINYIKANANNSFQLIVDIDYLDCTIMSLLCLVLAHNVHCCWYTYINDGLL